MWQQPWSTWGHSYRLSQLDVLLDELCTLGSLGHLPLEALYLLVVVLDLHEVLLLLLRALLLRLRQLLDLVLPCLDGLVETAHLLLHQLYLHVLRPDLALCMR